MANVPYKNIGEPLTHTDWDGLFAEADARITKAAAGLPVVLWGQSSNFIGITSSFWHQRWFWFYNDYSSAGDMDSIAARFCGGDPANHGVWHRKYVHAPIKTLVDGQALYSPLQISDDYRCVRIVLPSSGPLMTAFGISSTNFFGTTLFSLIGSLEAHKRVVSGKTYFVAFARTYEDPRLQTEFVDPWCPIEIVLGDNIGTELVWPDNWDKYNIFRFNNLAPFEITVKFGPAGSPHHTLVVPRMSSKCLRRTPTYIGGTAATATYTPGYNYFQKCKAGDPWFSSPWHTNGTRTTDGWFCNLLDPMGSAQMLSQVLIGSASNRGVRYDHRYCWDASPIYNGVDKPYGALADATPLGDLAIHKGKLLVVNPPGQFRVSRKQPITVDGATQQHYLRLADSSIALGVQDVAVKLAGVDIPSYSGGDPNWSVQGLVDIGGHDIGWIIVFFPRTTGTTPRLAVGDPVVVSFTALSADQKYWLDFTGMAGLANALAEVGITLTYPVAATPGAKHIKLETSAGVQRDLIGFGSNLGWVFWRRPGVTVGAGSSSILTDSILTNPAFPVVGWNLTVSGGMYYDIGSSIPATEKGFFDTLGSLRTQFGAVGGAAPVTAVAKMTGFGLVVAITQTLDLLYPSAGAYTFDDPYVGFYPEKIGGVWKLVRRDGMFVGAELPYSRTGLSWLAPGGAPQNWGWMVPGYRGVANWGMLGACTPRHERRWALWRNVNHDGALEPFWAGGWPNPTMEEPFLKNFYEGKPFRDAVPMPENNILTKTGVTVALPFLVGMDQFGKLSAWANYESGPLGIYTKGSPLQSTFYSVNRSQVLNGSNIDGNSGREVLPMSIEFFNAAAESVNISTRLLADKPDPLLTTTTLGLAKGGLFGIKVRPRSQAFCWDASAHPDTEARLTSLGVSVKRIADFPTSWSPLMSTMLWADATNGFATQEGAAVFTGRQNYLMDFWFGVKPGDAVVTNYRWIDFTGAQAMCVAYGIPFIQIEQVMPASLAVGTAQFTLLNSASTSAAGGQNRDWRPARSAVFVNDPSGDYVTELSTTKMRSSIAADDSNWILFNEGGSGFPPVFTYSLISYGWTQPVCCQRILDNTKVNKSKYEDVVKYVLDRRFGGRPGLAVMYPQSYSRFAQNTIVSVGAALALGGPLHENSIPKTNVSLSGGTPETTELLPDTETMITTAIENGLLQTYQHGRKLD